MKNGKTCHCDSGLPFNSCCQPILNDHSLATTAEKLMRSRYSAFVLKNSTYILASWHRKSRPKNLNFDDHPVQWLGLVIHSCSGGLENDSTGSVEFTSSYLENGQLCRLREDSQFLKEDGLWFYLRGECTVKKEKIARNQPCPCSSGRKFKRCCLNTTFS